MEREERTATMQPKPDYSDFWRWVAACLFAAMMLMTGYMSRGGITRAEAEQLIVGPTNPYIQDKATLDLRMNNIESRLGALQESTDNVQQSVNSLCIKLGVDPHSPAPYVHHNNSH
jgi:hypothetical protein